MKDVLENAVRAVIKRRMRRGTRDKVAKAAGHEDGSWVSNWLAKRQKHATLDELHAMAAALGLSLAKIISLHDAKISPDMATALADPEIVGAVEALIALQADSAYRTLTVQALRAAAHLPSVPKNSEQTPETTPAREASTTAAHKRRR